MAGISGRWTAFTIISIHYLFVYFHRVSPAVVAPELIRDFGISGTALGVLASAYFYAYGALQIPVGMLADSWGVRRTVSLFGALAALGGIAFGLSPGFATATASRVAVGLGVSAVFVCALKLFAEWYRQHEYARASGMLIAVGGIGWLFATTPLAFMAARYGWRVAFLAIGVLGLMLVVWTWFRLVEKPPSPVDRKEATGGQAGAGDRPGPGESFRKVLRHGRFWAVAVWIFCTNGVQFGFLGLWAGPYLMDVYGLSKPAAGTVLSMVALSMVAGAPLLGLLSDRIFASRKKILTATAILLVMCLGSLIVFAQALSYGILCAVFFFLGLSASAVGPIGVTAAKELFPNDMAGVAVGTVNLFPFAGGILLQPLIGVILDRSGTGSPYPASAYLPALWAFLAVGLIALASTLFVRETHRPPAPRSG